MKNIFKKLLILACYFTLVVLLISTETHGQSSETPFGGMRIITYGSETCMCSGNSHWIMDFASNSLKQLYFSQGQSRVFANNDIDYGTWEVGSYSSSSQSCEWIDPVDEDCEVLFTNDGTYGSSPGTGTSMNPILEGKKLLAFFSTKLPK